MQDFGEFLAARLARQRKEGEAHPAPDLLTSFAEGRLGSAERKQLLTHLAVCEDCREVLALAAASPLWGRAMRGRAAPRPRSWSWWNLRWATALATACVAGVVIWHSHSLPPTTPVHTAETAPQAESPKPEKPPVLTARAKVKRPFKMQGAAPPRVAPAIVAGVPELVAPPAPSIDEIAKAGQDSTPAAQPLDALKAAPPPMVSAHALAFQSSRPALMKAFGHLPRRQSLWSISMSQGLLQKSSDGGKTWTALPIGGRTNFLALSVTGPDIWAGGDGGALFHSPDDGTTWEEVPVTDGEERLTASIVGVEAQGSQVKVRTKSAKWISTDNGVSWRKMGE